MYLKLTAEPYLMPSNDKESIVIIDYGVGNLGSVANMLKKVGAQNVILTSNPDKIANAKKLLLPGVGSFDHGMNKLNNLGISDSLRHVATQKDISLMGICLGMQLLTEGSDEGSELGLGLVKGFTKKFENKKGLRVPHMGWNVAKPRKASLLIDDLPDESRFYFVHSYYVTCENNNDILCTTDYGGEFVSSFQAGNIIGCQFHPEKSHRFGIQLFKNFVKL